MTDLTELPWTAFDDGEIWADGERVGAMRTLALAKDACDAHNSALAARKAARRGVNLHGAVGVQIGDGGYQNNVF